MGITRTRRQMGKIRDKLLRKGGPWQPVDENLAEGVSELAGRRTHAGQTWESCLLCTEHSGTSQIERRYGSMTRKRKSDIESCLVQEGTATWKRSRAATWSGWLRSCIFHWHLAGPRMRLTAFEVFRSLKSKDRQVQPEEQALIYRSWGTWNNGLVFSSSIFNSV